MNEPRRFLDDTSAPPEVRRLLASAELPALADAARLARSRRRVAAFASLPAVGGGLLLLHKLALGALLGSIVGVGVEVGRRTFAAAPAPAPAGSAMPARGVGVRLAPSAVPTVERAVPSAAAPVGREGTGGSPAAAVPSASADVTRELELLEAARRVLDSDPNRALAILEQHAREAPRGTLVIERELLIIQALARLGRVDQAKVRAARFRAAHPESLYEERITRILEKKGE